MNEIIEIKTKETTFDKYIISGDSKRKELDVYHLIFAPTFLCNMHCQHCYLPNLKNELIEEESALQLVDEWSNIVEKKGKYKGVFHIKGGEPFMIPYLWKLIDKIISTGSLKLMITTNGTFNDNKTIQKLAEAKLKLKNNITIVVSLDGATDASYSRLRKAGAFDKVLDFIGNLDRLGIKFNLNYVVNKWNINEIEQFIELANNYKATQVNFLTLIPKGNATEIEDWQVNHIKSYKLIDRIYTTATPKIKKMLEGTIQDIRAKEVDGILSTSHECVAAYKGLLYILQNGDVYSCPNLVFDDCLLGNIKFSSLTEIMDKTEILYQKLSSHSGKFNCSGENKLYKEANDNSRLASLSHLQEQLHINSFREQKQSYCYNRNH